MTNVGEYASHMTSIQLPMELEFVSFFSEEKFLSNLKIC